MNKHFRYFKYVILHKWYVYNAGRALGGIPLWRLIIHDYSKFSRAEWTPYVNRFFGGRAGVEDKALDPQEFHEAWRHHYTHNPHHWEYWCLGTKIDPMPWPYVREMIADWLGAGRGIAGHWDLTEWYNSTKERRNPNLHDRTLEDVELIMHEEVFGLNGIIRRLQAG